MRFLILLPLLFAAYDGASLNAVQDPYAMYNGRLNKGIVKGKPDKNLAEPKFRELLNGHEKLAACPDYTIGYQFTRREHFQLTLKCNGKELWAYFTTDAVTRIDDLAQAPQLDIPGGWQNAAASEDKLFGWMESEKPAGCVVNYKDSAYKFVNGTAMEFTSPVVCGKGTKWTWYAFVFDISRFGQLQSIDEKAKMKGLDKMCLKNMKGLLVASKDQKNTLALLKYKGLLSDVEDAEKVKELNVVDGAFLELESGTQYCMLVQGKVEDKVKEAAIGLYKFNLETTVPFMVALPFENMQACNWFLKKISNQWITPNVYKL